MSGSPDSQATDVQPWAFWDASTLARVTGCPQAATAAHWPLIAAALDRRGIYGRDVCLGVLGTVAIETAATFRPLHEYGTPADWASYEGGAAYAGRGFIQLTHLSNYRAAGQALGIDLVEAPDLALDPVHAADILAWFWATKGVPAKDGSHFYTLVELCAEQDWTWVRRAVQGGTTGLDRLVAIVHALDAAATPTGGTPVPTPPTYDPAIPIVPQNHQWDCAEQSTLWGVTSLGRHPADAWMEEAMLSGGIESTEQGLLVGDGSRLAAWLTAQYGDPGEGTPTLAAMNAASVSFDDVRSVAGSTAVLIGGHHWGSAGHWSGVRGYDAANDVLLLANPANGYAGVGQTMTRQQFDAIGPCSMVVIRADGAPVPTPAPTPEPTPVPPTPPAEPTVVELQAELVAIRAERDALRLQVDTYATRLGYDSHDVAKALRDALAAAGAAIDSLERTAP